MEKDIRNQKVFVTLEAVLKIQDKLRNAGQQYNAKPSDTYLCGFYRGLEGAVRTLALPIDVDLDTVIRARADTPKEHAKQE